MSISSPSTVPLWGALPLEWIRSQQHHFSAERGWSQFHAPRNLALAMMGEVGELCECFQWKTATQCSDCLNAFTSEEKVHVGEELSDVMFYLVRLADMCGIDLALAARAKVRLNAKKYPVHLARGSSQKYDAYGEKTGYNKGSKQVTADEGTGDGGADFLAIEPGCPWSYLALEDLRAELSVFVLDRGWDKFHTPRDLALALSGEAGELCEVFQYKSETDCTVGLPSWDTDQKDKLAQ
ncbi:unnamed protein product, partial [Choristocarpus tenellus]